MGYTRQLGQLAYLITFDGSGNITVPASLTQGSVTSSMLKADVGGKLVAAVAGTDFVAPAGLSAYVPTTRTLTINGTTFDLSADRSWTIVSGVSSFNTRTGAITLTSGDVTTALGYTPVTNARTLTINGTTFDLSADRSWSIVAGLSSFNTRTGAITLLDTDVTGALGYTPVTNARTITINGTTYDLSANRTWVVDASSVTTRVIQKFTATSSQTTFTITGGYTVGMVDVFLNGIKLDNATEFTASNGSTVVLALGAATGDIVEVYKYGGQFIANNTLRQSTLFTATAGQTTFTVNYSVGFVDVFYNGSKLDSSEFTATNGTSIVLGTACVLNDKVEVVAYNYTVGAFTGVGGSGTTNYISKWTASGTLGNSLIFDDGTNVGIGTTTPLTILDVRQAATGAATVNVAFRDSSTNGNALQIWNGNNEARFRAVYYGTPSDQNITFYTITSGGAESEKMRISANGRVGIGTNSPNDLLEVRGGFIRLSATAGNGPQFNIYSNGQTNNHVTLAQGFALATDNIGYLYNRANADFVFGTNNAERMRISANGNVLINKSTATGYRFEVNGDIFFDKSDGTYIALGHNGSVKGYLGIGSQISSGGTTNDIGLQSNNSLSFATGTSFTERMRINQAGNVGIGIVPQTWSTAYKSIQISNASLLNDIGANTYLGNNTYVGSDGQWKYIISTGAAIMGLETNNWVFYSAASGTAGGNISWTERIQINSGGQLRFSNVPTNNYQVDSSIAISIANGGTIPFPNFSGLVIVNNMTNGVCAMWLCGAGFTLLIGQSTGGATGTLSYTGGNGGYTWTSNYGSTANYGVFAVRTRPTA